MDSIVTGGFFLLQHPIRYQSYSILVSFLNADSNCTFFMAARQLAGRRPLYFTADVSIILLTFFFFRRLISEVSGPIVTKLCHMFDGDCNFLNSVKNLGGPSPKKLGPKNIKISDFAL